MCCCPAPKTCTGRRAACACSGIESCECLGSELAWAKRGADVIPLRCQVEIEVLPKWEEKELFKTYMEDFNTGTLPHKKYYDNDSYERAKAIKEAKR